MDYIKRAQAKDIGPGGWTCRCCGPKTSRDAKRLRKAGRSRIKADTRKLSTEVV